MNIQEGYHTKGTAITKKSVIRGYNPGDRDELLAVRAESAAVTHQIWTPVMFERERQDIVEEFLPVCRDLCVLSTKVQSLVSFRSLTTKWAG